MQNNDYYLLKALTNWQPLSIKVGSFLKKPGTLENFSDLLNSLSDVDCVSFDIFDTLLYRNVEPLEQIQLMTAEWLSYQLGKAFSKEKLHEMRKEVEHEGRQQSLLQGFDAESPLAEIFERWQVAIEKASLLPLTFPTIAELLEFEIVNEERFLHLMPQALETLQAIKQAGKRIVAISDTYLHHSHIESILAAKGILPFIDRIYVSSYYRYTKGSGRLFRYLQESKELPLSTLHIGDHPISDVENPLKEGLKAIQFHNGENFLRKHVLEKATKVAQNWGDATALWALQSYPIPVDPIAKIGYLRFGPIFTLFALKVLKQSIEKPYEGVFFLARDAYLFQQLFECLKEKLQCFKGIAVPPSHYLYLSRVASHLAACQNQQEELLLMTERINRAEGVIGLFSLLGLSYEDFKESVDEILKIDSKKSGIEKNPRESIEILLSHPDFMALVTKHLDENKQLLVEYLKQEKLFSKSASHLLVDIGWNGSILAAIEKSFGCREDFPKMDALFFGRLYGVKVQQTSILPGYACDQMRVNPLEHLISESRELFEMASSSLEGTVLGYFKDSNGIISPKLAVRNPSEGESSGIKALQSGILAWCENFADFYDHFLPNVEGMRLDALMSAASLLVGRYPEELELLSGFSFDLNWGSEGRVTLKEYLGVSCSHETFFPPLNKEMLKVSLVDSGERGEGGNKQLFFEKIQTMVSALKSEQKLVFYGVGTVSSLIAPLLLEKISYFVDGNSHLHGKKFLDKMIYPPEKALLEEGITIFVTPINRKTVIGNRLAACKSKILFVDDYLD